MLSVDIISVRLLDFCSKGINVSTEATARNHDFESFTAEKCCGTISAADGADCNIMGIAVDPGIALVIQVALALNPPTNITHGNICKADCSFNLMEGITKNDFYLSCNTDIQ